MLLSRLLLTAMLLLLLPALGCGPADFSIGVRRQGYGYFNDLPYGFYPYDGYWHRDYCWYDGYWYHEGRGTPYWWDSPYYDDYYW